MGPREGCIDRDESQVGTDGFHLQAYDAGGEKAARKEGAQVLFH